MHKYPSTKSQTVTVNKYLSSSYKELQIIIDNLDALLLVGAGLEISLKYLGAFDTIPTERLDGTPIEDGDYYFNTVVGSEAIVFYNADEDTWYPVSSAQLLDYMQRSEAARDRAVEAENMSITEANRALIEANRSDTEADRSQTAADSIQGLEPVILQNAIDIGEIEARSILTPATQGLKGGRTFDADVPLSLDVPGLGFANTALPSDELIIQTATGPKRITRDALFSAQSVFDVRGNVVLLEGGNSGAVTDRNGETFTISPGIFPLVGVPLADGMAYLVAADVTANGITGSVVEYFAGQTVVWVNNAWTTETTGVRSFAGRTGDVSPAAGDYSATQVTSTSGNVQDDLDTHTTNITTNATDIADEIIVRGLADTALGVRIDEETAERKLIEAAMTKADFSALAEKRIRDSAGSGSTEWGKHLVAQAINQGMYGTASVSDTLYLGGGGTGVSRTGGAVFIVNGVRHVVENVNSSTTANVINYLDAPDGTKTYDSATGTVIEHANAATAFAAETPTNKVITSRKDFAFIESWHEAIDDKGIICPLGNTQYGASSFDGIALQNNVVQGYSAFGEWDTATRGFNALWANLTAAELQRFVSNPDNNVYYDSEVDKFIQVRYRIRVVEGLGDDWEQTNPDTDDLLRYGDKYYVAQRGSLATAEDSSSSFAFGSSYTGKGASTTLISQNGLYSPHNSGSNTDKAHNGLCFAIPIALVQRRNVGAYHPVFNINGTSTLNTNTSSTNGRQWYLSGVLRPESMSSCFVPVSNAGSDNTTIGYVVGTGSIGSPNKGRPDDKFYDAIYASDVQDLRMSSRRVPVEELLNKAHQMSVSGEVRGYEGVPFAQIFISNIATLGTSSSALKFNVTDVDGIVTGYGTTSSTVTPCVGSAIGKTTGKVYKIQSVRLVTNATVMWLQVGESVNTVEEFDVVVSVFKQHYQANPTWTDIVGAPARIAATFPDGVEGQWIPVIPDGTTLRYSLNRKSLDTQAQTRNTNDNGSTWTATVSTIQAITNDQTVTFPATRVRLMHYETQAHFTEDGVNSEVASLGDVTALSSPFVGTILVDSLIDAVPTSGTGLRMGSEALLRHTVKDGVLQNAPNYAAVEHTSSLLGVPTNDSPAVKMVPYLSESNGVGKLCYAYKEMVYDSGATSRGDAIVVSVGSTTGVAAYGLFVFEGFDNESLNNIIFQVEQSALPAVTRPANSLDGLTLIDGRIINSNGTQWWGLSVYSGSGWGDNNKFEVTNNQETFTDDNGNSGVRGTASFNTQFFIDKSSGAI